MNTQFQIAVKKLLQEYGHKIEEEAVLAGHHISLFIEMAVHAFGASREQAAAGLAYPTQLPKLLQEKIESIIKDLPQEVEKVEQEVQSIIKPVVKSITPAVTDTPITPAVSEDPTKSEMTFTVAE